MKFITSILVLILLTVGAWYLIQRNEAHAPDGQTGTLIAVANYSCSGDKTIKASYYDGESKPAQSTGMPPTPGGSVALVLSDGRGFTLPQTISGSGVRYSTADESFVFWNKGRGASVTETGKTPYTCIEVADDSGALPLVYANTEKGFSLRYPAGYALDEQYVYQAFGPGKDINGVKFTTDPAIAEGTNLSSDSYISVEQLPGVQECSAEQFVPAPYASSTSFTDGDTMYSVATSSEAAAGNRYEEMVYAIPGTNPCIAVRYFIHYGAIENYPEGQVKEFDKSALISQFDAIRRTLILQ